MNKKLVTIPAIMLAAVVGFSGKAAATSGDINVSAQGGPLGIHADANMQVRGEGEIHADMMGHGGIFGTVTAVNGSTITVQTKTFTKGSTTSTAATYTVNAGTAVVDKNNVTGTVSSIAVGDTIMVEGTVSGTTVAATKIHDGVMMKGTPGSNGGPNSGSTMPEGNGQPIIGGTVTAVSGNTITITNKSNVSYTIDATSAKLTKNGTTSTASSVAVGDNIVAQGTVNGTSVTAVSITDSANATTSTGVHAGFFGKIGGFFARLFGFSK